MRSLRKKTDYISIMFCSMAKYDKLLSENKIDKNIVYFVEDSIQDMQSLPIIFNESKTVKNILGVPVIG